MSETPLLFAGTVRDNIDPDYIFEDMELIKVLAYLGFYDLIKINTSSLKDLREWENVQNNPQHRMNMMVHLTDFIAQTNMLKMKLSCTGSALSVKSNMKSKVGLFNRLYEGLVGDMLSDKKFIF